MDNNKVLDSYLHRKEIVSRKFSQLAAVREETAIGYLRELERKYSPGETVADTPRNREECPRLVGREIEGALILEVPVQDAPVPLAVADEARSRGICIRRY